MMMVMKPYLHLVLEATKSIFNSQPSLNTLGKTILLHILSAYDFDEKLAIPKVIKKYKQDKAHPMESK